MENMDNNKMDNGVNAAEESTVTEKKRMKPMKKVLLVLLILLIAAMGGIYVYMGYYYQNRFYSGTVINGYPCGDKTVSYVADLMEKEIQAYTLTVELRDEEEVVFTSEEIGLAFNGTGEIEKILNEQNPWLWIGNVVKSKKYEIAAEKLYDEDAFTAKLKGMSFLLPDKMTAPADAKVEDNGKEYVIVPEVKGNTLDVDKTVQVIHDTIAAHENKVSLEEKGCYMEPAVLQDAPELKTELDNLNKLTGFQIVLDFGHGKETITRDLLKGWLKKDEKGAYFFDEPTVKEYVISMSPKYNTEGKKRDFVTTGGATVHLDKGDYGFRLWQDKTTEALMTALKEGKDATVEAVWLFKGQKHDGNEINGTYIEISIQQQHMWVYKDGKLLVETDVVTGNPNRGFGTPAGGVWNLKDKRSPYTLTGKKADGTIEYEEPVTYWMPFNGGVGIHDLTKRDAFGGNIYQTNGSHGCVNTPLEAMKIIYDNIQVNTPVVVY